MQENPFEPRLSLKKREKEPIDLDPTVSILPKRHTAIRFKKYPTPKLGLSLLDNLKAFP